MEAQPKSVVRQWRLALFPHDSRENFEFLVGRVAEVAIAGMFIAALYVFGSEWMRRSYALQEMEVKRAARRRSHKSGTLNKKDMQIKADSLADPGP